MSVFLFAVIKLIDTRRLTHVEICATLFTKPKCGHWLIYGGDIVFKLNSARVRALLFQSGLCMSDFAASTGLNVLTVKRAVNGNSPATLKTIRTLAKFFNVDPESLILERNGAHDSD